MGVDRLFASSQDPWSPKPRKRVIWRLIGITAGIFFLLALIKGALQPQARHTMEIFIRDWFQVSPEGLLRGRIWQLFTYQLLHGSGWHLVLNMMVLYFLGTFYEQLHGPRGLVTTYFLCGAFAGLACFLEQNHVVGASGSILALLLVLAVQMPNQQVILLFFPMRMKWVAVLIISLDVLQLLGSKQGSAVANWTHLAGAAAGFSYAYVWPRMITPKLGQARDSRRQKKEVAKRTKRVEDDQKLDQILDKISQSGMHSLTEDERKFLTRTSRKMQNSRRS